MNFTGVDVAHLTFGEITCDDYADRVLVTLLDYAWDGRAVMFDELACCWYEERHAGDGGECDDGSIML